VALNAPGYRSLALGYLRAYAEADVALGRRVAFQTLDLTTETDPWWVAYRLLEADPDVLAASVTCWSARQVYEVCRIVKAARPDTTIVLGGPEVGPIAEAVLGERPCVDVVVRGEGEATFAELLAVIARGKSAWRVEGVTARTPDGGIVSAPDRALIADLDSIPSPYLAGVLEPAEGAAYIESYRGCPQRCAYCYEGKGYARIRSFSQARVASEVAAFAEAGVRTFSFIDPVFNLTDQRLGWLTDILAPHAASGMRLHTVEVDIERIGEAEAALLARAGVASVETGPQTVGAAALETCRRRFDADRFAAGVAALRAVGISVECDLIAGLPGDTAADFFAGLEFCLALDPGRVQTSTLHVLPGTELWEQAGQLGLIFDSEPPHEIIATPDFAYTDLRRAEVRAVSIQRLYEARL
jgi:anaerobic magnesium-protoporphyrin IX monomethyl ester cyclase